MSHLSLAGLLFSCAALAQDPSFEVASVKPAPPPTGNGIRRMMKGGPGSDSPGQIDYSNVTLMGLITTAYKLKGFQVSAPDWVSSEGYDIIAKVPPNTTKEQFPLLLRTLLVERFHLVTHRDTKVLPVYAMVVGKNGLKLKEVDDGPGTGGMSMRRTGAGTRLWGKIRLDQLASNLGGQLDRPVLDMTNLPGIYDIDMSWMSDDSEKATVDSNAASSIFAALQDICGLKLETRKSPIEILVVDQVDKVPTAN